MATPTIGGNDRHRAGIRLALPAIFVGAILVAGAALNVYLALHRSLQLVNGFSVPVIVRLDDAQQAELPPGGRLALTVSEGRHEASMVVGDHTWNSGPFEVSSGMLDRMFKRPAFVLNAGCGAVVMWEEAIYGRPAPQNSGATRLVVGQPFVMFDDVDYLFAQFPKTVDLQRAGLVKKTRVQVLPLAAEQIMTAPDSLVSMTDRLTLAEAHLKVTPGNVALRQAYLEASQQHGQGQRAGLFLAALPGTN